MLPKLSQRFPAYIADIDYFHLTSVRDCIALHQKQHAAAELTKYSAHNAASAHDYLPDSSEN